MVVGEFAMKNFWLMILVMLLTCGTAWSTGHKQTGGALLGAGTGALIGAQIGNGDGRVAAIAIGTLAGALVGQDIGRTLDRADQVSMQQSSQIALETNRTNYASTWVNPDTGHSGSLTPTRTYQSSSGRYCREYQQTVIINGEQHEAYGTACRQGDGSWQIVAPGQPVEVKQVTRVRYVDPDPYVDYRYRNRYGYYSPFRGFISLGYFKHSYDHKYRHKHHYSGHRHQGRHYKGVHQRRHGGKGARFGHVNNRGHRRGHR
jgi:surface antigen